MMDANLYTTDYAGGDAVTEDVDRVAFVTLYTRVLLCLAENPRISQETLARRLDVTMRTAQRHLTELEEEGFIDVDRQSKPFKYSINWSKQWPMIPWLRLVVFHPEVMDGLRRLSDVAGETYDKAGRDGRDPAEALRELFASNATPVTAG
jgi:DNA-binding IclR family transcriptional regulator